MRDLWQTTNITYGANLGFATFPKKLKSSGVKRIIERALWEQDLRKPLARGEKRHEWKAAHGFRKFYKTRAEQAMKPINVEITMGHNIGLSSSYYRPTEREVLEDYLRAVDLLTISNSHYKLEKQISELKQKNKDNEYIIRGKLEEKDKEIGVLKWRPFRKLLDKQDRKKFDEMLSIPRLYNVAGTMVARPVISHVILMSVIFEHYKQLSKLATEKAKNQSYKINWI
jgi:hypothetical protein